jgi:hypothetical protein
MSTRYIVQNNQKGYWADWSHGYNIDHAIASCKHMSEQPIKNVDDICSWRVIKQEIVQVYPRNEVLHD